MYHEVINHGHHQDLLWNYWDCEVILTTAVMKSPSTDHHQLSFFSQGLQMHIQKSVRAWQWIGGSIFIYRHMYCAYISKGRVRKQALCDKGGLLSLLRKVFFCTC